MSSLHRNALLWCYKHCQAHAHKKLRCVEPWPPENRLPSALAFFSRSCAAAGPLPSPGPRSFSRSNGRQGCCVGSQSWAG